MAAISSTKVALRPASPRASGTKTSGMMKERDPRGGTVMLMFPEPSVVTGDTPLPLNVLRETSTPLGSSTATETSPGWLPLARPMITSIGTADGLWMVAEKSVRPPASGGTVACNVATSGAGTAAGLMKDFS